MCFMLSIIYSESLISFKTRDDEDAVLDGTVVRKIFKFWQADASSKNVLYGGSMR